MLTESPCEGCTQSRVLSVQGEQLNMSRSYPKAKDNPSNWGGLSEAEQARRKSPAWKKARHNEQVSLARDRRALEWMEKHTTTNGATGLRQTVYGKVGFAKTV